MRNPQRVEDPVTVLTPRQIYERLSRNVVGQDRAKRAVAIAAYNHLKRVALRRGRRPVQLKKSNVLLIGPTGSGKTHLARNLASILDVPFHVADATEFTEAGYYGKDVEVMVAELLVRANHSIEEAQRGIIFIDEVDKVARRAQGPRNGAGARDIGGEGVQQALLKLLEGREIFVPLNVTQHWTKHDYVQVNTADILFICAGTFSDLFAYSAENGRSVGFGARDGRPRTPRPIRTKDLVEYGMLAEFLGRLPIVVQLQELGPEELFEVLTGPPDAVVREYRELLAADDVELSLSEGALREIVRFAIDRGAGARGLRAIVEEVMADLLFESPERRGARVAIDVTWVRRRLGALDPALPMRD